MSFFDIDKANEAIKDAYSKETIYAGLAAWMPSTKYADNFDRTFYGVDRTKASFWTRENWSKWDMLRYRWRRARCWIAHKILRVSAE